jgi:hypothetical protein
MNNKNIISIFGCTFLIAALILSTNNVNIAFSQHEAQTTDIYDSQTILLDGKVIPAKNFIHLYTSAPSNIASAHIQAHIPCDSNGVSPLEVLGGMMIMPDLPPLNMTLDPMSTPGMICMYHLDITQQNGSKITDIALLNPTEQDIMLPNMTSAVIHVSGIATSQAGEEGEGEEHTATSH